MTKRWILALFGVCLAMGAWGAQAEQPENASAEPPAQSFFSDVPADHWAADAVNELARLGIMQGTKDGKFEGERPITRFEAAVALYRFIQKVEAALKKSGETFNDLKQTDPPQAIVPKGHWAYPAFAELSLYSFLSADQKIMKGPGTTLQPDDFAEALGQVAIRLTDLVAHEPEEETTDTTEEMQPPTHKNP